MICKYCGKEIKNANGICHACQYKRAHPKPESTTDIFSSSGAAEQEKTFHIERQESYFAPMTETEDEVPLYAPPRVTPKKRVLSTRGKVIIAVAAALLVVLIIIVAVGSFTSPSSKIIKSLEQGKYDTAYTLFIENYDAGGSSSLSVALEGRLNKIYDLYGSGEIDYNTVSAELSTIKKMSIGDIAKQLTETTKKVERLKVSKDSFESAEKHYSRAEYDLAIPAYKNVIKQDKNYVTAQEKLNHSKKYYRNEALSEASLKASDGDYSAGVEILKTALATLEKDSLIEKRIKEYKKSAEDNTYAEIIDVADRYAYNSDYESAIKAIKSAYDTNPQLKNNESLKSNLQYYTQKYIEDVCAEVRQLSKDKDYTAAASLIKKAEDLVGEQKDFEDLKNNMQGNLPTYLDTLTPQNSTAWEFTTETTLDSFGNDRGKEQNCIVLKGNSTAVYKISNYEFFSCYVAAAKEIDDAVKCRIKVTASVGGETRYNECEISSKTEPQELKFNVSECTELKFEIIGEGAKIIMYNANLTIS